MALRQGAMRLFNFSRAEMGFGSMNRVVLLGHAGKDVENIKLSEETEISRFSVATNVTYKDKEGQLVKDVEWHNITVYNPLLRDFASRFVRKGAKVYLEGRLRQRKFTDKEGVERSSAEVVLGRDSNLQVLSDKREDE